MNKRLVVLCSLAAAFTLTVIVANDLAKDWNQKQQADDSMRVLQQINADKLNPLAFQSRCGEPTSRERKGRQFFLAYPDQNVAVSYLWGEKAFDGYKSVSYWQMKPLEPIGLDQVVARLGCRPKP